MPALPPMAATIGTLQFDIGKTGGSVVTLADNWTNTAGGSFVHRSGRLDLSGRTVNLVYYSSAINSVRSLDITNAILNLTDYDYRGTGKTLASTGSHITTTRGVVVDGLTYPWVDANYTGSGSVFDINNTTFGQLTFNGTGTTVNADIERGNTIRRLEYKGRGIITGGGNTIDSLILAGSRNYFFGGTNTITKYLKAQSAPCAGLSEIRNYTPAGSTGTLAFSAGAVVEMANVYMENMTATGPITPIAFSGADAGGNSGWTITSAAGGARYWVGGGGDWNDGGHWSAISGGTGGTACVPTVYDDVYFDANSGFGTTVLPRRDHNNGNAYARIINWTGAANSPIWSKSASWTLEVWGDSLITIPAATFTVSPLVLKGPNTTYLKGAAPTGIFDIRIDKTGGSLTLLNDYSNAQTDIYFTNGAFNAPGKTLNVNSLDNQGSANIFSVDISGATINATAWGYYGPAAGHTLNAANSTITAIVFNVVGLTYNKVNVSGAGVNNAVLNNATLDSLTFTDPGTTSVVGINGANNTLNYVEYKGSGGLYATGNTIDTLVMFPGKIYTFTAGTTTNITGEWYASGTPCNLTEIVSSSITANATINKTGGAPEFDYMRLRRITAAGSIPFIARNHTINQGNNINWNIEPYNGAAPIHGLGVDTAIAPADFPYVLRTDGFFGSPSSSYLWNDNSTADSLEITGPGTFSVNVGFVDGCNISDQIVIGLASTLPVTLRSFTAINKDCQSLLNWKVTDVSNFSHFVVEQSKDGRPFTGLGQVLYEPGVDEYAYTDKAQGNGTILYRLRLVDMDGTYKYSSIASVNRDCDTKLVQVYPTVTNQFVKVVLPQGYEKAQLYIINTAGQRIIAAGQTSSLLRTVNLEGLPAGTYLLQVINHRETKSYKIIKQ